jgi:hypothetical protein
MEIITQNLTVMSSAPELKPLCDQGFFIARGWISPVLIMGRIVRYSQYITIVNSRHSLSPVLFSITIKYCN